MEPLGDRDGHYQRQRASAGVLPVDVPLRLNIKDDGEVKRLARSDGLGVKDRPHADEGLGPLEGRPRPARVQWSLSTDRRRGPQRRCGPDETTAPSIHLHAISTAPYRWTCVHCRLQPRGAKPLLPWIGRAF